MSQNPNNAPNAAPAPKGSLFAITANSHRELMLKVAMEVLRTGQFVEVPKTDKDGKPTGEYYMLWNLDDSGKVNPGYNDGISLSPDEARTLPTTKGFPIVFSGSLVLRQLVPAANLQSRIDSRKAATVERNTKAASKLSEDVLLAALNAQRIARGEKPIE